MHTWAKAHATPGYAEAQRQARQLVRMAAHPSATNKLELRSSMAELAYSDHVPERDDLFYQLETLIDPHNRGERKGPVEAPISAENLTDMTLGRKEMLARLRDNANTVPDGLWEWARFVLLWTRGWYQAAQPHLADDPSVRKHPELAQLYAAETFESMMNAACGDLLSVLSVAKLATRATHLPPEQRPDPWLAGKFQLKVTSRRQLSALLLPDGSRQGYLELFIQLIQLGDAR
jgi:hypothetical protein